MSLLCGVVVAVHGADEEGRSRTAARLTKLGAIVAADDEEEFSFECIRITHVVCLDSSPLLEQRYRHSFVVTEKWLECCEIQGRRAIELEYLLQSVQVEAPQRAERRLSVFSDEVVVATPSVVNVAVTQSQENSPRAIPIPGVRSASPWEDYGRPSQLSPSPQLHTRSRKREQVDHHILATIRKANRKEEARANKEKKKKDRRDSRGGAQLTENKPPPEAVCPGVDREGEGEVHVVARVNVRTRCCVEPAAALSAPSKSDPCADADEEPSSTGKPYKSRTKGFAALSSLENRSRKDCLLIFQNLKGFVVVKDVNLVGPMSRITHLILGSEKRTAKVLLAIVSGAWFLSSSWVHDSKRKGRWLEESEYEVQGAFTQAAQRARAARKAGFNPLCKMFKIHLFGGKADHRKSLKQLCVAMGALVTNKRTKCDYQIWCDTHASYLNTSERREEDVIRNKPVIHQEWILKSAQDYKLYPSERYELENV
jgi:hypothetical protein